MSRFQIDFSELLLLAEVCKTSRLIARATFWQDLCDKHYHKMSKNERLKIYELISKDLDLEQEDARYFVARFNPGNQFIAICFLNKKKQNIPCFKFNGRYHINKRQSINEDYIKYVTENKLTNGAKSIPDSCIGDDCMIKNQYSCDKCELNPSPFLNED